MREATELLRPEKIVEIILRRRWLLIIPFCFSMLAGIYSALTLPRIYAASTLILVQPQRVPTAYVRSIVSTDIESRISTISQQIMSRTNIEKIIDQFKIFSDPKYEKMFREDKIENMRTRISVHVSKARRGADAFTIEFKGQKPQMVMRVANTLATYFIDENLKVREAQAIGTSNFLDAEMESIKKVLEQKEKAGREYRQRFMGGLPEQLDTNLRILDRLQENIAKKQEALGEARSRHMLLERQFADDKKLQASAKPTAAGGAIPETQTQDALKLQQHKSMLEDLLTKYTDQHPDIIRTRKLIRDLEKKTIAQKSSLKPVSNQSQSDPRSGVSEKRNVQELSIEEVKAEIRKLQDEMSVLKQQVNLYQKRIEEAPKREQELLSLNRDYNNIQSAYNTMLNRKLEAGIAVNMEKKQKGEQFQVLDPAKLPEKPVEPDMKKLFMLFVLAGLGIGAGLTFVLEYLDTSFRDPKEIQTVIGLPTLAMISRIYMPGEKKLARLNLLGSILSAIFSLALLGAFFAVTLKYPDTAPDLLRKISAIKGVIF